MSAQHPVQSEVRALADWPEGQRQTVLALARASILEYSRGAVDPTVDERGNAAGSAVDRACRDARVYRFGIAADCVHALVFNRWMMRSRARFVPPEEIVRAGVTDRAYLGPGLMALAEARVRDGWNWPTEPLWAEPGAMPRLLH